MGHDKVQQGLRDAAPLLDPVRRSLYLYVLDAEGDVGRDEAASAVGVARSLAAFHLDKLVDAGLLEAGYRRLSGRSGPGAGRPAKVYGPSSREIDVRVPHRDYELAARLLLEGIRSSSRSPDALRSAARHMGRALGEEARPPNHRRPTASRLTSALLQTLEARGFQPKVSADGVIRLLNCPFHALVSEYRDTVCGLNRALLEGVVEALGARHLRAAPDDAPPGCCVAFRPRTSGRRP